MAFNMGVGGFLAFRQMLRAIEAAREALDSRWARQVGARAARIADMLTTGTRRGA